MPLKHEFYNPGLIVPGKNGEAHCRKGMVFGRHEFEKMKDEYYGIRGWDVSNGLQTRSKLEELNLSDVADRLDSLGLLAKSVIAS